MRDELERRYHQLRKQSISLANQALITPNVKLTLVDHVSYAAFKKWKDHPDRRLEWNWPSS